VRAAVAEAALAREASPTGRRRAVGTAPRSRARASLRDRHARQSSRAERDETERSEAAARRVPTSQRK